MDIEVNYPSQCALVEAQSAKPLKILTISFIKPPTLTQIVLTFLKKHLLDYSNHSFLKVIYTYLMVVQFSLKYKCFFHSFSDARLLFRPLCLQRRVYIVFYFCYKIFYQIDFEYVLPLKLCLLQYPIHCVVSFAMFFPYLS